VAWIEVSPRSAGRGNSALAAGLLQVRDYYTNVARLDRLTGRNQQRRVVPPAARRSAGNCVFTTAVADNAVGVGLEYVLTIFWAARTMAMRDPAADRAP